MESSILISTKKLLGLAPDYTVYDLDVITHINEAFSVLEQLGVGPIEGFYIEGDRDEWEDLGLPQKQLSMVRTYVFLKVRRLFDPPSVGFLADAMDRQIQEAEWRLNNFREVDIA